MLNFHLAAVHSESFFRYKHDVDKDLVQIQFVAANGKPLGVLNWFAVHPTSMNNTNHLVSSDNVGLASILFEKRINKNALVGKVYKTTRSL